VHKTLLDLHLSHHVETEVSMLLPTLYDRFTSTHKLCRPDMNISLTCDASTSCRLRQRCRVVRLLGNSEGVPNTRLIKHLLYCRMPPARIARAWCT
jgi:hypothetical protein